jgi:hypothetical protein
VKVKLTATPTAGGHSATMLIDDPQTKGLDGSMMAVVAAGDTFTGPQYTVTKTGVAKRNVAKSYFVTVPAGVKALEVSMSGLETNSQTRFLAFHPYGVPLDSTSTPNCYPHYPSDADEGNGCDPHSRAYSNPTPGVWEVLVESRRTSPLLANPYTLTVKLLGATVNPAVVTVDGATVGEPTPVSWQVHNDFAGVTAHAEGGSLGSSFGERASISDGGSLEYEVTVPEGATRFDMSIGNPSDPSADLYLYLLDADGNQVTYDADGDSEESISITDPEPGTYTVLVDGYAVPAGTTLIDYRDTFFATALGSVDVPSTVFDFPSGSDHTVSGTVTVKQEAAEGRSLRGSMTVLSATGAVIATGEVAIGAVSP